MPHVLFFGLIGDDIGAVDEEERGVFVDECEDAIFCLFSKGVVVCDSEGLDDEMLDLIHQMWRYYSIIIIGGRVWLVLVI